MKKQEQRHFLPEVEAQIQKDQYSGASLSDVMAPLLKRLIEGKLG